MCYLTLGWNVWITWLAHVQQDRQFWALVGNFSYAIIFWKAPFFLHATSYSQITSIWQGHRPANSEFLWAPESRKSLFLPSSRSSLSPGHLEILENQWLLLVQVGLEGQGDLEAQGTHLSQAVPCTAQVVHLFQDLLFPLASLGFLYHLLRSEVLQTPWLKS